MYDHDLGTLDHLRYRLSEKFVLDPTYESKNFRTQTFWKSNFFCQIEFHTDRSIPVRQFRRSYLIDFCLCPTTIMIDLRELVSSAGHEEFNGELTDF